MMFILMYIMYSFLFYFFVIFCVFYFFFFFQAEDGIRDVAVTGVQTCALPISGRCRRPSRDTGAVAGFLAGREAVRVSPGLRSPGRDDVRRRPGRRVHAVPRSEERRVGKECRSGGSA